MTLLRGDIGCSMEPLLFPPLIGSLLEHFAWGVRHLNWFVLGFIVFVFIHPGIIIN